MKQFYYMMLSLFLFANTYAMEGRETKAIRSIDNDPVLVSGSMMQQFVISGIVTDSNGSPMIGVNVVVDGTTIGVVTDINGKYTINVPNQQAVLQFSFIGYLTEKLSVGGQKTIDVKLIEDITNLQEVVVTALGIKREKKALGYSSSTVKSDELVKAGSPINPLNSLYGKSSGVKIASTANGPSGGMIINIRNSVSLTSTSNTRPLFVVDGIPIFDENTGSNRNDRDGRDRGTGINDINANDIESLEILKGAKAAVLYGYAGANGVVLITTKAGKKQKGFGVDFSTSYSWDKVANTAELQNEFGTGQNVAVAGIAPDMTDSNGFKYKMVDGNKVPTYFKADFSFGPKMDGRDILWWDGQMRPYTPQKDNVNELFETGHLRSNSISFSNGGELGNFRASYTNKNYQSVMLNSNQDNHIFSFNGSLKASKKVTVNYTSNYYYTFNHNAPFRMQDGFVTYGIPRDSKTELLKNNIVDATGVYWYFRDKTISNEIGAPLMSGIADEYFWNQTQNTYDETRHHFIQSAKINIDFTKWLNLSVQSGFDYTRKMDEVKKKLQKPLSMDPFQGYYSVGERNILNLYNQALLNFDKKISDLRVSATVGGIYQRNSDNKTSSLTQNFLVENWFSLGNSRNDVKSEGSGTRASDLLYSALGSAQIAYKDYLYVEFQGRNDWSSILPPSNNSYFYPGASISWVASETFKLPDFIKYFKTRVSIADVGRPGPRYFGNLAFDISSYGGVPYATASSSIPPADFVKGIASGTMPPENLKPERKREAEFGFEMLFFENSRLGIDFSVFRSNTYDQIIGLDVPRSSGAEKIIVNAGNVQNNGIELQLKGKPIMTHDFVWDMTLNLSKYKTKVIELSKGITVLPLWGVTGAYYEARVGEEYGEIFINPWLRDDKNNIVVDPSTGVYQFDKTKKNKVGHLLPDLSGGFNTNASYKGFTLDFDFDFQFGGTLISQTNMYLKGNGSGKESLKYRDEARGGLPYYVNNSGTKILLDSHSAGVPSDSKYNFIFHDGVVLPGVKPDGKINDVLIAAQEYYTRTYWQGGMDVTEDAVYKSDYFALRRITLSYLLPHRLLNKTFINNARLAIFATNVAYLYKAVPNVIPESSAGTNEFTEYSGIPGVRSFGFELKLSF